MEECSKSKPADILPVPCARNLARFKELIPATKLKLDEASIGHLYLAKAVAYHPKERVRDPTDGALINLSNVL